MQQRKRLSVRTQLVLALRVRARDIASSTSRRFAACDARSIPKTRAERFKKGWGRMAAMGRSILARLSETPPEEFEEAARTLRQCADAVQQGLEIVSETQLGEHNRRNYRNEENRS